ncbi:hypothetical protein [Bacillus mojavensis]|uniref:hypothetical protein n=1 Tax=Bacillus mojavensis TaxID=72360 RepID=UPI00227DB901|nr:hypothetical protein [Bacillus mojavensis]MCY9190094.1 hypothetical protein [Bacillus mojavensis]
MPNSINYVSKYQDALDQKLVQGALTAELETPNVNWLDAKTFKVQSVSTTGYKPHTRNKGYNEGTVTTTEKPYTLEFDRDIEFFVDKADVDESNQAASASNVTATFTTEHATPELDAYRFSKLAKYAIDRKQIETGAIDKENIFTTLKAAIRPLRKYGPGNLIAYVSSEVMDALELSKDFTRKIDVTNNNGTLETRVSSIDGVRLVEVWDESRFYDSFDFSEGFKPAEGAKKINFLIVAKTNVIAKAKFNSVYLFAPGQHTEGDGYLYQNRIYHDLFMLENKQDGVIVSLEQTTP